MGFNVNSIQRRIEPLNPQMGFNVNSTQRRIQLLNPQFFFLFFKQNFFEIKER